MVRRHQSEGTVVHDLAQSERPWFCSRSGLTLVELSFLIALIAVAFLIASKWTIKTRVDQRQAACLANLQALAAATSNYEHTYGYYPPGLIWSVGAGREAAESSLVTGTGGFVAMLPYLERIAAYSAINFDLPIHTVQNTTVCGWDVSANFSCPADTAYMHSAVDDRLLPGVSRAGTHFVSKSNYAFVAGPWVVNTWKIHGIGSGERSSYPEAIRNQLGMFNVHSSVRQSDIRDGTSQTVMIGERTLQALPEQARRDSFWWFSGNHGDTLMSTMFPPVTPGIEYPPEIASLTASSQHERGVVFAFADGSARLVKIDPALAAKSKPLAVPKQKVPHLQGFMTPDIEAQIIGPDPFWDTVFRLRSGARFSILQRLSTRQGDGPDEYVKY
jgi:hypothetical protein